LNRLKLKPDQWKKTLELGIAKGEADIKELEAKIKPLKERVNDIETKALAESARIGAGGITSDKRGEMLTKLLAVSGHITENSDKGFADSYAQSDKIIRDKWPLTPGEKIVLSPTELE